jgi:hypothetical protein
MLEVQNINCVNNLSQSHNMFLFRSQKYMPRRKTGEETNFTYVECLLYTFHHLAHKVVDFKCFVCLNNRLCVSTAQYLT